MSSDRTIHFDGHCLLCSRSVHFILKHDKRRMYRFAMLPVDREHVDATARPGTVLLSEGSRVYKESTAVIRILLGLGFPWNIFGVFLFVPTTIRDSAYRFIAVRRYRWFGYSHQCYRPDPLFMDRFV